MLCTTPHHRTLHSIIVQSGTRQKSCKPSVAPPRKNRRPHQRYEFALAVHHIRSSDKHYIKYYSSIELYWWLIRYLYSPYSNKRVNNAIVDMQLVREHFTFRNRVKQFGLKCLGKTMLAIVTPSKKHSVIFFF